MDNTANQKTAKPLYTRRYNTQPFRRMSPVSRINYVSHCIWHGITKESVYTSDKWDILCIVYHEKALHNKYIFLWSQTKLAEETTGSRIPRSFLLINIEKRRFISTKRENIPVGRKEGTVCLMSNVAVLDYSLLFFSFFPASLPHTN